jgi:hypothetical protein
MCRLILYSLLFPLLKLTLAYSGLQSLIRHDEHEFTLFTIYIVFIIKIPKLLTLLISTPESLICLI